MMTAAFVVSAAQHAGKHAWLGVSAAQVIQLLRFGIIYPRPDRWFEKRLFPFRPLFDLSPAQGKVVEECLFLCSRAWLPCRRVRGERKAFEFFITVHADSVC